MCWQAFTKRLDVLEAKAAAAANNLRTLRDPTLGKFQEVVRRGIVFRGLILTRLYVVMPFSVGINADWTGPSFMKDGNRGGGIVDAGVKDSR